MEADCAATRPEPANSKRAMSGNAKRNFFMGESSLIRCQR
jgi:hypothetical protein